MGLMAWSPLTSNVTDTLTPGLKKFFKDAGVGVKAKDTANFKALAAVGLQLLNFTLNGSSKEKVVPPIRWGVLRGSGSVFADGVFLGDTKANHPNGTPNQEYSDSAKPGDVVVGFNTAYAARWHERQFVPGGVRPSRQAVANPDMLVDVGNKFVEKHLRADGEVLLGLYADIFKKEMGT